MHLKQSFGTSDSQEQVLPQSKLGLPGAVDYCLSVLRELSGKCYNSRQQRICNRSNLGQGDVKNSFCNVCSIKEDSSAAWDVDMTVSCDVPYT